MSIFEVAKNILNMKEAVARKFGATHPYTNSFYYVANTQSYPNVEKAYKSLMEVQ